MSEEPLYEDDIEERNFSLENKVYKIEQNLKTELYIMPVIFLGIILMRKILK